jgi:hypothetical protein
MLVIYQNCLMRFKYKINTHIDPTSEEGRATGMRIHTYIEFLASFSRIFLQVLNIIFYHNLHTQQSAPPKHKHKARKSRSPSFLFH